MCMVDYAESADVLDSAVRKCRKPRKCSECKRVIKKGEQYEYTSWFRSGEKWEHVSTCRHCQFAREWLERECRGWVYGGVLEDLREHWLEGIHTMELGRLIVSMKRKWTRKDGALIEPGKASFAA